MTATALGGTGAGAAVAWTLRLALGTAVDGRAPAEWGTVLEVAARERCAALAWWRSGAFIRSAAPPEVAGRWRSLAVQVDRDGRAQLALLAEVLRALELAGVEPVVLKGAPLAARLYGQPFVRPIADADLLVPEPQRAAARRALAALGWRHADGEPPWEEAWTLGEGRETRYLDVHSRLLDHNLAHLPAAAIDQETVEVEGVSLRAHAGPLLPAFLASHASKHRVPPLLWFVDLDTLWASLPAEGRRHALEAARSHRLGRYLRWGIERARDVRAAAEGDVAALRRLGVGGGERRDAHPAVRDAWLAASPIDAARSLAAWAVPVPLRGRPAALAARFAARARSLARAATAGPVRHDTR